MEKECDLCKRDPRIEGGQLCETCAEAIRHVIKSVENGTVAVATAPRFRACREHGLNFVPGICVMCAAASAHNDKMQTMLAKAAA